MPKDVLYKVPQQKVAPFEFNQDVAVVFDDMIQRSVPFYREIIQRQAQLIKLFYHPKSIIYDLGCSNGNLGIHLCEVMPDNFKMIAVDSSKPMLTVYEEKLASSPLKDRIELQCNDILSVNLTQASVIVLNLTLQFLPMNQRYELLKQIYSALLPGGIFLFTEKIIHPEDSFSELQKKFYYDFKKENGYCELEISQKREALENVLIPETIEAHLNRLQQIGFQKTDIWFKWFNFCSLVCQK
ncbi:MAG: carboxy-S-adenosyl-L-methionine synthase CmoA [Deltaproteobacteria bacterium]|nr:MAG: carboxy-S-adenosyl-L-methionine synthase CmoA [Deltaproteobacteria bacterium]